MEQLSLSPELVIYLIGLAATWGAVMWRISALEKKMDKHNCLIERMAVAERDIEDSQRRLEQLEGQNEY